MARKAVDLFSLLASRGGPRSQRRSGGFLSGVSAVFGSLFSRSRLRGERRRPIQLSRMGVTGVVLACMVVGYLLGDSFPLRRAGTALDSRAAEPKSKPEGQRPGNIGDGLDAVRLSAEREVELLTNQAFFPLLYRDDEREKAADLALQLRAAGIGKARIYRAKYKDSSYWAVVAYFDGDKDQEATRQKLLDVPAPPNHPVFAKKRSEVPGWPLARPLDAQ